MRIWHEKLIPCLCRQHLLAVWREGLGCLKIITEGKKGYRNHPATQEFINAPSQLLERLYRIRQEMLHRGYKPKEIPSCRILDTGIVKEWESLEVQREKLKAKGCSCRV
jgi:hypothetical protein